MTRVLRADPTAPRRLRDGGAPEGRDPRAQPASKRLPRDVRPHERRRGARGNRPGAPPHHRHSTSCEMASLACWGPGFDSRRRRSAPRAPRRDASSPPPPPHADASSDSAAAAAASSVAPPPNHPRCTSPFPSTGVACPPLVSVTSREDVFGVFRDGVLVLRRDANPSRGDGSIPPRARQTKRRVLLRASVRGRVEKHDDIHGVHHIFREIRDGVPVAHANARSRREVEGGEASARNRAAA